MLAKLHAEAALRLNGTREDNEAAGFLVEPLHDAQPRPRIVFFPGQFHADLPHDKIVKGQHEQPAFLEPILLRGMAHGADPRRLLDDDKLLINVANRNLIDVHLRRLLGTREHFDGIAILESSCVIEPDFTVELDAPSINELADLGPALAG
jgi:hypothetical protein